MLMFVACVVGDGGAAWPVWRPAFRYDGDAKQLLFVAGGAGRPCALSALLPGVERALPAPVRRSEARLETRLDFGRVGGRFDDSGAERDRPFDDRFNKTGRLDVSAVWALVAPPVLESPPRVLFAAGLEAAAAKLVAHMPPELVFAVAARLKQRARATPPRVVDVCRAVYESVKALSPSVLAPKLDAEEARHAVVGGWHAIGYSSSAQTPDWAVAPNAAEPADFEATAASNAARVLATIVERKQQTSANDGLDAAALVSDRRLLWTSAVALGLLSHTESKTRVATVAEWAAETLDVAADDAADDAYY
jgi:hypothetical protein